MNPSYPVYIISKGRYDYAHTANDLTRMKVPFKIVIEPQEYDNYAAIIPPAKILVLPFSNLGQGSIPARNWVWEHALSTGAKKHWILDDNIRRFFRVNKNMRSRVNSGAIFKIAEDFTERYINVAFSGFNYMYFVTPQERIDPYWLNTRIYSCILIKNDLSYRWRGRYNEDTDLCLRALKDDWCTILFNAFIMDKVPTLTMKGGNTDSVYNDGSNRLKFAESLKEQHPDMVKVVWRYNRWHHDIDYNIFKKNKLIKKEGLVIPDRVNNYSMRLVDWQKYLKENNLDET